ncbi:DUF2807 domain-containing protein [Reichenbachiella agarivorans]|uniref:DUF2807 domain-containing protein n=1 Tax=Reichenbachiella agarivorans TaxID=2979464 RepID=A0ABY6CMM0_9BACT|nr:head GIN domain-containing protein [Reichenbachiella agarivorans]UXP31624.1 DUF2807 domain-containing protein [Reichenbachiella agarivorans]
MKKIYILAVAILVGASCTYAQNEESRSLESFSEVSTSESIKVTLVKGNKNEARIITSNVDTDKVLTDINGESLNIHMTRGSYMNNSVEVILTYSGELSKIKASSSGQIKSDNKLVSNELYVKASSSGKVYLDVSANQLKVDVSSSGKVELSGQTKTQVVEASSSGKYDGFDMVSEGAKVDVSSSGKVDISVSKELFADASSSGKVTYRGTPEKVMADTSSSGSVRKD